MAKARTEFRLDVHPETIQPELFCFRILTAARKINLRRAQAWQICQDQSFPAFLEAGWRWRPEALAAGGAVAELAAAARPRNEGLIRLPTAVVSAISCRAHFGSVGIPHTLIHTH